VAFLRSGSPESRFQSSSDPRPGDLALRNRVIGFAALDLAPGCILGTVFIYADYSIPVEAVREELKRIVAQLTRSDQKKDQRAL
jgi:hypothetical protein